jgi:hypothetical protein
MESPAQFHGDERDNEVLSGVDTPTGILSPLEISRSTAL